MRVTRTPEVTEPVLIEGLPGIGHVGRIAAKYLCTELRAKKFAILHSENFPPQVVIRKSGLIQTMKNEFYYWKAEGEEQRDLLFVIGNSQASTPQGQYQLCNQILDAVADCKVETIVTLGGLGTGQIVEKPTVYGAVTHPRFIPELEKLKVVVKRAAPGQIIGASGLLLALGKLRGVNGFCLMGETSGFYLDPNSAKAVLEVLSQFLHIEVDVEKLVQKAKDTQKRMAEAQRMERKMMEQMGVVQKEPTPDEMRYIG
jgi:hypothetical protein